MMWRGEGFPVRPRQPQSLPDSMNANASQPPPAKIVLWIIWFAITVGLVMIYSFAAPKAPAGGQGSNPLQYLPLLPLAISVFIRWVLLPRQKAIAAALPVFVIGLAMAEGCGIIGMFIVPQLKQTYLVLALLGLFQFVPFWANKLE